MMQLLRSFSHNWPAKVLSVIAAIILWFFVMKEQNPVIEASYTVPVQVSNLSEHYIAEGVPKEVKVMLKGPRNTMLAINPAVLRAYVDLSDASIGQENVAVRFNPPSGLVLSDMSPSSVPVTIDEYTSKAVAVEIQALGKIPDDVAIKKQEIVPNVATVMGPSQVLKRVARVVLRATISDHKENFTSTGVLVPLDAKGNEVDGVRVIPRDGQAQFEVERIRMDKTVPVTATFTGSLPAGYKLGTVVITPAQVTVTGKEASLKELEAVQTTPIVLTGVNSSIEGDFSVLSPDGITTDPAKVHVVVNVVRSGGTGITYDTNH